jgi:chemotaxis protein CheX
MFNSTLTQDSYGVQEFLSTENLSHADDAVVEVFSMMAGIEIGPVAESAPDVPRDSNELTAIVGFSGAMRGTCEVRMTSLAARTVAAAMLGGPLAEEGDESIDGAFGELCNMLAGGWKGRVPLLTADCALSPPTVISGGNYKVHMRQPSVKVARIYRFDEHMLYLTLYREDLASA